MTWKTSLTIAATTLIVAGPAMAQTPAPGGTPAPRWRAVPEHTRRPDAAHARLHDPRPPRQLRPGDAGPDPGRPVPTGSGAAAGQLHVQPGNSGHAATGADQVARPGRQPLDNWGASTRS